MSKTATQTKINPYKRIRSQNSQLTIGLWIEKKTLTTIRVDSPGVRLPGGFCTAEQWIAMDVSCWKQEQQQ